MCRRTSQCPECGRFTSGVIATTNELQGIIKVEGTCKIHGRVNLDDGEWWWEDFNDEEE